MKHHDRNFDIQESLPRDSKYPIFGVSGQKHTLNGLWDQKPEHIGYQKYPVEDIIHSQHPSGRDTRKDCFKWAVQESGAMILTPNSKALILRTPTKRPRI